VAPNVVLSAAHCYDNETDIVTLGMHKINLATGESAEFYNIEHIPIAETISHPDYNDTTLNNDYWMIRLQWASTLYSGNAIALDTLSDDLVLTSGRELVVMGFGTLATEGSYPNTMQKVVVNMYPMSTVCRPTPDMIPLISHQPCSVLHSQERILAR